MPSGPRWIGVWAIRAVLLLGLAGHAAAAPVDVDLQLVLAVDVSRSMDPDEQVLQREGYVAAFRDPGVIDAIQSGILGRIAVTYVEWAGSPFQHVRVPWMLVDGRDSAARFADAMAAIPYSRLQRTSISSALLFSSRLFADSGFAANRNVIDVSGDGPNNQGVAIEVARAQVLAAGIVINGLPVLLKRRQFSGFFDIDQLDDYYEDCVIGGVGSFIVPVGDRSEFAAATRRKLILEIASRTPPPRVIPAQAQRLVPRVDCMVGEKLWMQWMGGME
jgi:hypothetical protein